MSAGKGCRRRWVHEGEKREACGFTLTPAERRIRRSDYLTKAEAQEAAGLIRWTEAGPLRSNEKSVEELIGKSLTKRRG